LICVDRSKNGSRIAVKERIVELEKNENEQVTNDPVVADETYSPGAILNGKLPQIDVRIVDVLSNYAVLGVLVGFTPGEVAILVNERLSEERTVAVHLNSFSFEGQTLYCGPKEDQYEVHVSIDDIEGAGLRRSPRFPVTIPAELLQGDGGPVTITIRDISRDGMGIESPLALEEGQAIAVASGPVFVFAVVRYCRPMPGGMFRVGVEMHHLFERPPEPPTEPPKQGFLRGLWGRCSSKRPGLRTHSKLVRVTE
jgi:hypothetical protein